MWKLPPTCCMSHQHDYWRFLAAAMASTAKLPAPNDASRSDPPASARHTKKWSRRWALRVSVCARGHRAEVVRGRVWAKGLGQAEQQAVEEVVANIGAACACVHVCICM